MVLTEVDVINRLEALFYEFRPYFLLALGIYVLGAQDPSPFAIACVLILMVCSTLIIRFRMKARRGSSLEQLFYDMQPVIYFCLAGYAMVWLHHSKLALACALILLFCATMIVRWRLGRK